MPKENVEVVRAFVERWNSGVREVPTQDVDPGVVLETPFSSVSGKPYRGYAGVEQWLRDVDEQFSLWRVHIDELRAEGNAVIALGSVHGKGRVSGIELDQPNAIVVEFTPDHRIIRARIDLDVDAALADWPSRTTASASGS
jgi:ketosteroid isomerase-like protein